jgi:arginase
MTRLVGVPIDCSGRFIGVERMPAALRAAGLVEQLGIQDAGDLLVTIDSPERDAATGIIGFPSVCKSSETIRIEIGKLLERGERPLVVGGCCTLLIGVGAALCEQFGPVGLAFVDGHLDCYTGQSSPTGETADMELAILTGIGPSGLIDLGGPAPLIAPENIVVLGHRDPEELGPGGVGGAAVVAPGITLFDVPAIRQTGPARVGIEMAKRFETRPGRFWLHLDLDALDERALPAVDYRMPNGLDWQEVRDLVRPLAQSPSVIGMDVTIYNPSLDPDGCYAKRIVELLTDVVRSPVAEA